MRLTRNKNYLIVVFFVAFFPFSLEGINGWRRSMLNQVVLVGRLTSDLELQDTYSGKRRTFLTLAVQRTFKNIDGEYDTDFVDIVLWDSIAENTVEYCRKGDVVGIKGRIQTSIYELEDGSKRKNTKVVAERVTFLSSKKEDSE